MLLQDIGRLRRRASGPPTCPRRRGTMPSGPSSTGSPRPCRAPMQQPRADCCAPRSPRRSEHGRCTWSCRPARRAFARTAAFLNGTAAHTAEFDDIHRDSAPSIRAAPRSPPRSPAAQATGCDGETFLRGRRCRLRGLDPHRAGDDAGALQVLARHGDDLDLRRLGRLRAHPRPATATRARMRWRRRSTMAAGLQQAFRSDAMSKPIHAGHAAEAGRDERHGGGRRA